MSLSRRLLPAILAILALAGTGAARAQDASTPAAAVDGGSATGGYVPQGYVPQGYVPLDRSTKSVPAQPQGAPPDDGSTDDRPAAKKAAEDDITPEPKPAFSFQAPGIAPRADGGETNFAPVVAPRVGDVTLVDGSGGLPRLYAPGFRLGPFDIRPDLTTQGTYNDNIYLTPRHEPKRSDYIISVSPRVDVAYANGAPGEIDSTHFDLIYAPTILEFVDNPGNSSFNQQFDASFDHRFSKLRLALEQTYAHTSGGIIQAGDLVDHDAYVTSGDLSYQFTPKTSTELVASYLIDRFSTGIGSDEFDSLLFVNYETRPKLTFSVAPSFGYVSPQGGGFDQTTVGGVARGSYLYSDRTSVYAQVGGDQREYNGSSLSTLELTYVVGAHWVAGPKTSVDLSTSRKTRSSALSVNEDYVATDAGFNITQSLVERITAVLSGGYEHSDYYSTISGTTTQTYDYFNISPALVYHPSVWSDLGISYTYRQNLTNVSGRDFLNNQITVFSTIRF